jgi:DNA polymerase-3 subunit epsilon
VNSPTDLPEWARTLAVFDTETTGLAPETTRIVSAHVSLLDSDGRVSEARDWLINPGIEIPEIATSVHGITTEYAVEHGREPAAAIAEILVVLSAHLDSGIPLVAYNASYDFTILDREAKRYGLDPLGDLRPVIDPLVIDKQVDRYRKGKRRLENAAAHYQVSLDNAHDASADAIAAGRIAQALARVHAEKLSMTALQLHDAQVLWAAEQAASFAAYLTSQGKKPYADDGTWPVR